MIKNITVDNKIWETPFLPPPPSVVGDNSEPCFCISNRIKGEWQFLYREILDIPSPYQNEQDYNFGTISDDEWQDCIVPGSLIMQSFDIKNNTEYYYKKQISLPSAMLNSKVFIRFEGVYSNARIWINNQYITTHIGGFTPFDVDITQFFGAPITLIVGISDIESKNLGTWNKEGIAMSDASWASYYAHCNIGGILRDVTVYSLSQSFILSNEIKTVLTDNYTNATLTADMILVSPNENITIEVAMFDMQNTLVKRESYQINSTYKISSNYYNNQLDIKYDKKYIRKNKKAYAQDIKYSHKYVKFNKCKINDHLYSCSISLNLVKIACWTAETPYLYWVNISLSANGKVLQTIPSKVGFREIEYGGANNTDKNKVYINGKSIKLRGVCRHDASHLYGRSITKSEAYAEIQSYKNNNINHIRTSHYPASKYLLDACDELGIYVELENAVCFKGANGYAMLCAPQQIMQNLSEMIAYYRNNPSIIIWSYGNESSYKKSIAFRLSYQYLKEKDPTRPVIFSYPSTINDKPPAYDIFSKHYANVNGNLGSKDISILHDEFAHVACYNIKDLERDNNCRLAWGKSIAQGWANIMSTDGALGCAIWSGIDDVFCIPQNTSSSHQRHTAGKAVGYGEWGAILDVFKREKPEAYLTKKAFSPIRMSVLSASNDKIQLKLDNWFDHVDLNCVKIVVNNRDGARLVELLISKSIPARESGDIELNIQNNSETYYDVIFYYGDYEIEREIIERQTKLFQNSKNAGIKSIATEDNVIKVNYEKCTVCIDKMASSISIFYEGELLASGIGILLNGSKVNKIISNKMNIIHQTKNRLTLSIMEHLNIFSAVKYLINLEDSGISITASQNMGMHSRIQCSIRNAIKLRSSLFSQSNIGSILQLHKPIESVEWEKGCDFTHYPNGHIERKQGKAILCKGDNNLYRELPPDNWKDDNYNHFLIDCNDIEALAVTNDFKTTRSNVSQYSINFDNLSKLTILAEQKAEINCLTETSKIKKIVLCTDNGITRTGRWRVKYKNSAKVCLASKTKNSSVSLPFYGDGIKIFGTRSKRQGDIEIYIDDNLYKTVSTKSDICDTLEYSIIDSIIGLECKNHKLTIKIKDNHGAKINSFEVLNCSEKTYQSQLLISSGIYYPSLGWGNYCGKLSSKNKELRYKIKL